jgi:hypothetical protein
MANDGPKTPRNHGENDAPAEDPRTVRGDAAGGDGTFVTTSEETVVTTFESAASPQTDAEGLSSAGEMDETVGTKREELAGSSQPTGSESVKGASRATDPIADCAASQVTDYVRAAAKQIERLADDLRHKNVGDILSSVVEYGRTHPVMMLAGAAFVGFALSRVVKAGVANPGRNGYADNNSVDTTAGFEPIRDLS